MLPSYHDMAQQSDIRRDDLLQAAEQHNQAQQSPANRSQPGPLNSALGKLGNVMVSVGEELQTRSGSISTDQPNLNQNCV